jgi:hypothetical protein
MYEVRVLFLEIEGGALRREAATATYGATACRWTMYYRIARILASSRLPIRFMSFNRSIRFLHPISYICG